MLKSLNHLNINASIEKQKLIVDRNTEEQLGLYFLVFIFSLLATCGMILVYQTLVNVSNQNLTSTILALLLTLFSIYIIYRKLTEKKLRYQQTSYNRDHNRQLLLDWANRKGFQTERSNTEVLIFEKEMFFIDRGATCSFVLIVLDHKIHWTVLKKPDRISMPAITAHLIFKYQLKQLFK
jgi:hypothetical protein